MQASNRLTVNIALHTMLKSLPTMGGQMPSRSDEFVHIWNRCYNCGAAPIVGLCFNCQTCPAGADNDLCAACYRLFENGLVEHPSRQARVAPTGRHLFRAIEGAAREQVLSWLTVPVPTAAAPAVPDRFVVRPEVRSGMESFIGSYGFVVATPDGGALMITALHVLDELAKWKSIDCSEANADYTGRELPQQITGVQLYDPFAPNWMLAELGTAGSMLSLPNARTCSVEPYSQNDLAAFRVAPPHSFHPLPLAAATPVVGEPIWLASKPAREAEERTSQAVVVEIADDTLVFRFALGATIPPHGSGAPLLNRAGEVVGINIGGGILDGHKLGHGSHVASIRHHLGC
jgi:hypothetical protein